MTNLTKEQLNEIAAGARGIEVSQQAEIVSRLLTAEAQLAELGSNRQFFMYSDETGFEKHATSEAAIKSAQEMIDVCREDAGDGWPEETDTICWGVVVQRAVETDFQNPSEDNGFLGSCDYKLTPETQQSTRPVPQAVSNQDYMCDSSYIAGLKAGYNLGVDENDTELNVCIDSYRKQMLNSKPQAVSQLERDVSAVVGLLEDQEWAEHCSVRTELGRRLENAVTELHNQLGEASQPYGEYGDAYQGAREDLCIWKKRALEAENKVRAQEKIIDHLGSELNACNGPTFMGEPVVRPASQPYTVPDERPADSSDGNDAEAWFDEGWNACRAAMLNGDKS